MTRRKFWEGDFTMNLNKLIIKRLLIVLSISLNICFLYLAYQNNLLEKESKLTYTYEELFGIYSKEK